MNHVNHQKNFVVYTSYDKIRVFLQVRLLITYPKGAKPVIDAVLYTGTKEGVFRSDDGDDSWVSVNKELTSFS